MASLWYICTVLAITGKSIGLDAGDKVDDWVKHPVGNPEELGDYFEGDIILPDRKRSGLISETRKWPNGEVPYEITGSFSAGQFNLILRAMNIISNKTCIKFRPRTKADKDYVRITSQHRGCYSYAGKIGGAQTLNLQTPGCVYLVGTPIHELLHAVGFYHEQSRPDRDDHVEILWDNIQEGRKSNFAKYKNDYVSHYGVNYDYGSVMHYSGNAFSKNGLPTIVGKGSKRNAPLGQRYTISDLDAKKVNAMYNCTI